MRKLFRDNETLLEISERSHLVKYEPLTTLLSPKSGLAIAVCSKLGELQSKIGWRYD